MAKKILLVEDDKFLSDILSKRLQNTGFETRTSKTADDAFSLLNKETVDIILLDLILPGMSGFDFLKIVSADEKLRKIPIIVLSNLGQQEEIKKAKSLGAKYYMVKAHHTTEEIIRKIEEFLV